MDYQKEFVENMKTIITELQMENRELFNKTIEQKEEILRINKKNGTIMQSLTEQKEEIARLNNMIKDLNFC
jgi:hypothetical protein